MRSLHRGVRSPQAGLLGGVLVLVCALVLPTGPLARALDEGTPETSINAASTSLVFACDPPVPMAVHVVVEPGEVVDGGSVTVSWALSLPTADEWDAPDTLEVSVPVPGEVSALPAVEVVATSGIDRTAWSTGVDRLVVELALAGDQAPIEATVVASMDLRPGVAPAVVAIGAPDGLVLGGVGAGGDERCGPQVPVPSLVSVVVSQAAPPTTVTTAPTTSTTAPGPTTTRPWASVTTTTRPPDPAADGDAPSPPPIAPADVPPLPPPSDPSTASEVVTAGAGGAEVRLEGAREDLTTSAQELEAMERRSAALERRERHLAAERRDMAAKLEHRRDETARLAAAAYVAAVDSYVSLAATSDDVIVLGTALEQGTSTYLRLLGRQAEVDAQLRAVAERRVDGRASLDQAEARHRRLRSQVTDGEYQLTTFELGGELAVTGFRFPVAGRTDFSDTWHAPRSGGRLHQGTDLFAPEGTPLRSVERGVLARVGHDTLGGTKLWLVGESGTQYYYAHLSAFAPGVADGVVVDAGAVIGYVGHTGNARTTPPHLHFEVHPGGGDAIDAYPMLRAADLVARTGTGTAPATPDRPSPATTTTTTTTATTTTTTTTTSAPDSSGADTRGPTASALRTRPRAASGWGDAGEVADGLDRPAAVAVAPDGAVVVADTAADRIVVLGADGAVVRSWGGTGSARGRFHEPAGVAVGSDGTVYVADTGNARVQRFTSAGELLDSWDGTGTADGALARPTGVAVDADDRVYVVDSLNSDVRVFDADGTPVRTWGGLGDDPGQFADPVGIAVGPDGDLYVADRFNGRVQRLTPRGEPVAQWTEGLRRPVAVTVTAEGALVVVDGAARVLRQYDADGHLLRSWGRAQLDRPEAVALDQAGRLLVADPGGGRLLAFRWGAPSEAGGASVR